MGTVTVPADVALALVLALVLALDSPPPEAESDAVPEPPEEQAARSMASTATGITARRVSALPRDRCEEVMSLPSLVSTTGAGCPGH